MAVEAPTQRASGPPDVANKTLAEALGVSRRRREVGGDTRGYMLRRLLLIADVAALVAAFSIVELTGGLDGGPHRSLAFDVALLAIATPIWLIVARAHGLYHLDSRRADHGTAEEIAPILQMTTLWSWSVLLLASATGLRSVPLSKLILFWALIFVLLLGFRAATRTWARRRTWYLQNALVVGTPAESAAIATKLLRHPEYGINLVAGLELSGDGSSPVGAGVEETEPTRLLGPVPLIRGDVDVLEIVGELDVDRVLLASSVGSLSGRVRLMSELAELDIHLDLIPGWGEAVGSRLELNELEGMPLLTLPYMRWPRSSLVCKRLLDLTVTACALAVISPLLAACALAIKLDSPGPVFFRQRRVGKDGRRFELLKFRSMRVDAEQLKEEIADLNAHGGGTDHGMFKIPRDPRITRVGRLLRRFSLDELPQLLNVLRSDMSLVGPRPLIENEHSQIEGRFRKRVDLTPGLTGLWQVHGRSNIPFEGMVDLDYLYVTNWSLWRDVKLLMRTVAVVARGQGAY